MEFLDFSPEMVLLSLYLQVIPYLTEGCTETAAVFALYLRKEQYSWFLAMELFRIAAKIMTAG